jgi:hypothetical protein
MYGFMRWVPALGAVTEVDAGLEQLADGDDALAVAHIEGDVEFGRREFRLDLKGHGGLTFLALVPLPRSSGPETPDDAKVAAVTPRGPPGACGFTIGRAV